MTSPRIAPLDPPDESARRAELAKWPSPGGDHDALALFRLLIVDLPLSEAVRRFGAHMLGGSTIDPLARELVIARVCANTGCSYEWGVHVAVFAGPAGLSPDQITATAAPGVDETLWDPREVALLRFVDELCSTGSVGDVAWTQVAAHFDDAQMLTLLALAGWYHVISFVANGARVPQEPWAPGLPTQQR